jgi:hypothetical protein
MGQTGFANLYSPTEVVGLPALHSHGVAVQVAFEKANFETSFSLHRLKGWVTKPGATFKRYGSTGFNLYTPHDGGALARRVEAERDGGVGIRARRSRGFSLVLCIAVQVALFESKA